MKNISVEELKSRMDAGEKITLIDVREPHEYAEFNLGGTLVPLGKIQTMQIDEIEDLKEQLSYRKRYAAIGQDHTTIADSSPRGGRGDCAAERRRGTGRKCGAAREVFCG